MCAAFDVDKPAITCYNNQAEYKQSSKSKSNSIGAISSVG